MTLRIVGCMRLPSGDYIAGLADGEGCFVLKFRRDVKRRKSSQSVYFYWDAEFAMMLREDDRDLLELVKSALGCGRISINSYGGARFAINTIDDLVNIVIPFFKKYPLYGKKQHDLKLWEEGIMILMRNQKVGVNAVKGEKGFKRTAWSSLDLKRLAEIHKEMKPYKSKQKEWRWLSVANKMASI